MICICRLLLGNIPSRQFPLEIFTPVGQIIGGGGQILWYTGINSIPCFYRS